MNALEIELLLKRIRRPVENWDKVAEGIQRLSARGHWDELFGILYGLTERIYNEVYSEPKKVSLLERKPINLGLVLPGLWGNPDAVITADHARSYIILREHGFDIKRLGNQNYSHSMRLILITKTLSPPVLGSILGDPSLSRAEKLKRMNGLMNRNSLRALVDLLEEGGNRNRQVDKNERKSK